MNILGGAAMAAVVSAACGAEVNLNHRAEAGVVVYPQVKEQGMQGKKVVVKSYCEKENSSQLADKPEGYIIELTQAGGLTLEYATAAGRYYGLQTLSQMLGNTQAHTPVTQVPQNLIGAELPQGRLLDSPDLPLRGTVEGFYGQPWSHEARLSQLRFYGRNKMNTYIYGPKDDPYHSARWREPYPQDEAQRIAELARVARENHVNFYWAIHPGHNIQWNDEDMHRVMEKFELMYALGVRSFAVFFDDISGEGTKPEMQAKLMNMLQKEFVYAKGDISPLII